MTTRSAHILLVDDDAAVCQVLVALLDAAGYQVTAVAAGAAALQVLESGTVDVVVTDPCMHDPGGIDVVRAARCRPAPPEVIVLAAHASLETAIAAVRTGVFDYLLKPAQASELLDSVARATERRTGDLRRFEILRVIAAEFEPFYRGEGLDSPSLAPPAAESNRYLRVGGLELDRYQYTGRYASQPLQLTPIEFNLLVHLAEAPGRAFSAAAIVRRTHGYALDEADAQALLRSHVRNVRRKLPPALLVTVRGAGYMLVAPADADDPDRHGR